MYIADDLSRDPMKFNETEDDEVLLTQKKDLEDTHAIYTLIEPKQIVAQSKNEE